MTQAKVLEISFRSVLLNPPRIVRLEVHPDDLTFFLNGYAVHQWGNMGQYEVQASLPFASLSLDTGEFVEDERFTKSGNDTLMLLIADAWNWSNGDGWSLGQKKYLSSLDGWSGVRNSLNSMSAAELPHAASRDFSE